MSSIRIASNTPSDPLAKFLLPVPVTLCSAGLEVLVPEGGGLPPGDTTMIPLNWKLIKAATWPFWVPHAFESTRQGTESLC